MIVMKRAMLVAVLLAVGCKKAPSEDQCKQLLDHLVDLEFKKAGAAAGAESQKADLAMKTINDHRADGVLIRSKWWWWWWWW